MSQEHLDTTPLTWPQDNRQWFSILPSSWTRSASGPGSWRPRLDAQPVVFHPAFFLDQVSLGTRKLAAKAGCEGGESGMLRRDPTRELPSALPSPSTSRSSFCRDGRRHSRSGRPGSSQDGPGGRSSRGALRILEPCCILKMLRNGLEGGGWERAGGTLRNGSSGSRDVEVCTEGKLEPESDGTGEQMEAVLW